MHPKRKKRITTLSIIFCGLSLAIGLVLFSLRENINLFYTPSTLLTANVTATQHIRLGGMVLADSIEHAKQSLSVNFKVADESKIIQVHYEGVLPDLFRENQGVVIEGVLQNNIFEAEKVLAKHDENYMPPGVKGKSRVAKSSFLKK